MKQKLLYLALAILISLEITAGNFDVIVAKDGTGNFTTVQEAINAVPDFRKVRTRILIKAGIYKEKVIIPPTKTFLSLIGEGETIITYDDYASKRNKYGEEIGTSGSSTLYIFAPDLFAENITFENASGPVGQAVACFVAADRVHFKHCRFLGFQDTLYTNYDQSRQYYEECDIWGSVDFIFGASTCIFNKCHIHSLADGFLTAPSTNEGEKYGYIFYDCRITAEQGVKNVYLSRPWRPYGKAVFIRCELGEHINPLGWDPWDKPEPQNTVFYAEYKNSGKGAATKHRATFSRQLKNLDEYVMEKILAREDGWNPMQAKE